MNTKLTIKNSVNEILQTCIFHEQETMDAFIAMIAANATFGKPEQTIHHPAIEDGNGEEVLEASVEVIPSEYTIEITDCTTEVNQQKINVEALQYLAQTDYLVIRSIDTGVDYSAEIKQERANARSRIVR